MHSAQCVFTQCVCVSYAIVHCRHKTQTAAEEMLEAECTVHNTQQHGWVWGSPELGAGRRPNIFI